MFKLSKEVAKEIIDLNPGKVIDQEIADRQFEVIIKGFNYLCQPENKYLYIADEVGLGKTYIALGIASLLRYFATDDRLQTYQDLIIVPKKNLQFKWQKEIKNFVTNNFHKESNRVKSILGKPIAINGESQIHNHFELIDSSIPSYEIFRNSSFSLGLSGEGWKQKLLNRLDEYGQSIMQQAFKYYKVKDTYTSEESYPEIKRLFGYLMNISIESVDLIIVDEAHNYKHGVGHHVAYRNQVMSRFMGVVDDLEDEDIFKLFPELRSKIAPKAKKVIFLSATPMDNGCHEIKNLLDVFISDHPYKGLSSQESDEIIKIELSQFMMRGLMKITLNNSSYSRNQYRYEHRSGNVNKNETPVIQKIDDPFMSATIGLIQLKTAEVLNHKNHGGAFEMGMNASFETFNVNKSNESDVDEGNQRNNKKGVDEDVVAQIVNSYKETFKSELPHPKQQGLIIQLFEKMKRGEKSLVFVRRIASVNEITRKLVNKYENFICDRINDLKCQSSDIEVMLKAFENRSFRSQFLDYLENISQRIWSINKHDVLFVNMEDDSGDPVQEIFERLDTIFHMELDVPSVSSLYELIKSKMHLSSVPSEIRLEALSVHNTEFDISEDDVESEESAAGHRYFFLDYFTTAYKKGLAFKNFISKQDWYRYNYFYLLKRRGYGVKPDMLLEGKVYETRIESASKRSDDKNELLIEASLKGDNLDQVHDSYKEKTFFTCLLEDLLATEWAAWLYDKKREHLLLDDLLEEVESLLEILRGVFRNGSGLLPSYIAYCENGHKDFSSSFIDLLESHFKDVLKEVKTVLIDYDKLITTNFPDKSKIRTSLYQQAPVLPSSGQHTRGVSGIALQFRMPGFPYVVVTTDVLKEGEDLHTYCNDIYHYGIAWNPSDMEQRTGRIDRINSKTYYGLTSDKNINFDNSLHVFYPYLSDTLEVNQMAKLFTKMNQFVATFYDVTTTIEKDSKASSHDSIVNIPEQNKEKLESKFDYDKFTATSGNSFENIVIPDHYGIRRNVLEKVMEEILVYLKEMPHLQECNFNSSKLSIKGVLKVISEIGERKGPYVINIVHNSNSIGVFDILLSSKICNVNDIRSQRKRTEMSAILADNNQFLFIEGNYINSAQALPLDSSSGLIIETLKRVTITADNLEIRYTGKDED